MNTSIFSYMNFRISVPDIQSCKSPSIDVMCPSDETLSVVATFGGGSVIYSDLSSGPSTNGRHFKAL